MGSLAFWAGLLLLVLAAGLGGALLDRRRYREGETFEARRLRALGARAEASEARLHELDAMLEQLPGPLILFGAGRTIRRLNAEARALLGDGAPSLLRMPAFRAALERAATDGTDAHADLQLATPIARELHVRVTPITGEQTRLIALLTDRTHERAVERMRADFVANASHELRTPLTALIGFIDTLRGPAADDPDAQTRFLAIMAEQAQRMNRLIDDLLGLSRIELTEHLPPSGSVDLAALIEATLASLEPLYIAREVRPEVTIEPGLPNVPGDRDQLSQVLQNLIENAIKYGKDGGTLTITARQLARAEVPGVALSVRDQGAGIPARHLPRLTERFYRVSTRRSREVGGTGLGLAIVKHIVNRHRGHLRIESQEGVGTGVTVWLPR